MFRPANGDAASVKNFRVKMTLPGIMANTSASDFYPLEQMQMQRFDGEGWVRFGPLIGAGDTGS